MYGDDGKVKDIYFYRQMSSDEQHIKVSHSTCPTLFQHDPMFTLLYKYKTHMQMQSEPA